MIDFTTPTPLPTAVENISTRTPIGRALSSDEWAIVPAELRMRAMFSARVEEERYLVSMQDKIEQRIRLARENGTTMDRGRFIAEMQDDLRAFGYEPDPRKRGSMQDISSAGRLGLIYEMNLAMAEGYSSWKMGMDKDILDAAPARELVRLANRQDKRPWPAIWSAYGGKFYGDAPHPDFPDAPGRMIALASDPIWVKISEFGTPWPPFRWGSGVGLRNVRRREAEKFSLLDAKTKVKPLDTPFNSAAKASLKGIPEARRKVLAEEFLGEVEINGDEMSLIPLERYADSGGRGKRAKKITYSEKDQPAPTGRAKISEKVKVSTLETITSPIVARKVKVALRAVDSIHDVPEITPTNVVIKTLMNGVAGRFFLNDGTPVILINPYSHNIEMTVWHELAHALDHLAWQGQGSRFYASQGQPNAKLIRVMSQINQSSAVTRLRNDPSTESYWTQPSEMIARAYAQYVAEKLQNQDAMNYIREVRQGKYEAEFIGKNTQWAKADFRRIFEAFEKFISPTST